MIEIKNFKNEEKKCDKACEKHDPCLCNMQIEQDVKICSALEAISKVVNEKKLDYEDFWNVIQLLDHYYNNWFEMCEVDVKDYDEICSVELPYILEEW